MCVSDQFRVIFRHGLHFELLFDPQKQKRMKSDISFDFSRNRPSFKPSFMEIGEDSEIDFLSYNLEVGNAQVSLAPNNESKNG